jgi:hypothetical protein
MRKKNMRFVWAGLLLAAIAGLFFLGMTTLVPRSHDPVGLMREVGRVSGVGVGIGLFLAGLGMIGKKV